MAAPNFIWPWLYEVSQYVGNRIFRANQNGQKPPFGEAYITYQVIAQTGKDHPLFVKRWTVPDNTIEVDYNNKQTITVSVNVYDWDGREMIAKLKQSGNLLQVRLILQAENAVLIRSGEIRDLTALGDTHYIPRYQCDFDFNIWSTVTEQNEPILDYQIDGIWQP